MSKKCPHCDNVKDESEFNKSKSKKDGFQSWCKDCCSKHHKQYAQNLKYEVLDHYSALRGMNDYDGKPITTPCCGCCQRNDLDKLNIDHMAGHGRVHRKSIGTDGGGGWRFYLWLKKQGLPFGYQTLCDDCNDNKRRWEKEDRHREVNQFDLEGNLVATHPSMTEAHRKTGAMRQRISDVCRKVPHRKTAGGFIWKYA